MGDTWHSCIHLPNTCVTLATHAPTFQAWMTLGNHAPTFLMYKRGVSNPIKGHQVHLINILLIEYYQRRIIVEEKKTIVIRKISKKYFVIIFEISIQAIFVSPLSLTRSPMLIS